jgi:hypothetical protein
MTYVRSVLFQGCASEDSAQFEEHAAMSGCSDRPAELDWPKYRTGNKHNHRVTGVPRS